MERTRSSRFIASFQEEFAKILGITVSEAEAMRSKIRRSIVEKYLNGMEVFLRNDHDLSWKILFRAAEYLNAQEKQITVRGLIHHTGLTFRRKLDLKVRQSSKNSHSKMDKTPGKNVQILQGGLTGVGGKHSRKSRGSGKK